MIYSYHGLAVYLILTLAQGRLVAHCQSAHQHSTSPIFCVLLKRVVKVWLRPPWECCVDSLVDLEGMVGLKQHCNVSPCPHHYLLHTPRVLGNETANIIHLSEFWDSERIMGIKNSKCVPNLSSDCYMSVVGLVQFAEFSPSEATHWLHVWTSSLGVVRSTARCKWLVSVPRHSRFLSDQYQFFSALAAWPDDRWCADMLTRS